MCYARMANRHGRFLYIFFGCHHTGLDYDFRIMNLDHLLNLPFFPSVSLQEDAHMVVLDMSNHDAEHTTRPKTTLFGIFDGHGGKEVALFAAVHLPTILLNTPAYLAGDMATALSQAFLNTDKLLVMKEHRAELKALKGEAEEISGGGGGNSGNEGMTINSSQLPGALLDALGVSGESGYVFRIVKMANGQMRMISNGDEEEEEEEEGGVQPQEEGDKVGTIIELVDGKEEDISPAAATGGGDIDNSSPFAGASLESGGAAAAGAGKRKRGTTMDLDETTNENQEEGGRALADIPPNEMVIEELNPTLREDEKEWLGPSAGCTAVCALVRDGVLVVANAGDSRCVLSRQGRAVAMTEDHKPMDPIEYDRIVKAGGFVADGRVNGSLNLSRALGDLEYKQTKELPAEAQMVTAHPEVRSEKLVEGDEFLILACDGIWDVLTNQEAVDFVRKRLRQGKSPKQICEEACDHCLAPDTKGCGKGCDNMSIIVAVFVGSKVVVGHSTQSDL